MPTLYCENINCKKEFKSRKSKRKFCSHPCYIEHRKSNPEDYSEGTFKSGSAPWNKGKKSDKYRYELLDIQNPRHLKRIVKGSIHGDRRMQKIIFESLYGKMMVIAMRYAKDQDEADDILSESFIKAFDNLTKFNGTNLHGWVGRIVANTSIDLIRKKKAQKTQSSVFQDDDASIAYNDENFDLDGVKYIKGIPAEKVLNAIQQLSPMYKAVFNMYIFEDYTHKEIAEILEISEGTSKSNLFKAKLNLRNKLELDYRMGKESDEKNLSLVNNELNEKAKEGV